MSEIDTDDVPIGRSEVVEDFLSDFSAAKWAWHQLWSPNQDKFTVMNILDSIVLNQGNIESWLFTSATSGEVKSRGKSRWTAPAVCEKCEDFGHRSLELSLKAHYWVPHTFTDKVHNSEAAIWKTLEVGNIGKFVGKASTIHAILSYSHVQGTYSFVDVSIEDSKRISEPAKVVTKSLYNGNKIDLGAKKANPYEKVEKVNYALPQQKLTCLNKVICTSTQAFMTALKRELEARGRRKIIKLTAVLLLETADDGTKISWLHHVSEIVFKSLNNNNRAGAGEGMSEYNDMLERRSNTASEISLGAGETHKYGKCSGDFCQYPLDEDEAQSMMSTAAAQETGNFRAELKKARQRHRRDDEDSPSKKDDPNDIKIGNSSRANDEGSSSANDVIKKLAKKVPFKSIALCRQEGVTWESLGKQSAYDYATMPWPQTLYQWWFQVGKSLNSHASGAGVPVSGGNSITNAMIGMNPIPESQDDGGGSSPSSNSPTKIVGLEDVQGPIGSDQMKLKSQDGGILYDLQENAFNGHKRRSVGQMSWYYSSSHVCNTCYHVYRDIDRRREHMQNKSLKAMRKHVALTTGKLGKEYDKDIESRIFAQRRFVSRMSKKKLRDESGSIYENRSHTSPATSRTKSASKPPKGILPPLPWQLRDQENATQYANSNKFDSAIVRNIRNKAQGMARLVQLDKQELKKRFMMKGGMLDADSHVLDETNMHASEDQAWQQFTGQSRAEYEQHLASKKPRKVTGGLGENRPKPKSKNFDPDRLMHTWQKEAKELADRVRGRTREANDVDDMYRAPESYENSNYGGNMNNMDLGQGSIASFDDNMMNQLNQGSMVSQLTMEPSMMNLENQKNLKQSSMGSLDGLDDEEWIRAVMVRGKGNVNLSELSIASSSRAKTPKGSAKVSFKDDTYPTASTAAKSETTKANYSRNDDDNNDDYDDDDDDDGEEIGWSPFVIPAT